LYVVALSIRMPRPAVPLIVLPFKVSVKVEPPIVTSCPTPVVIQIPPKVDGFAVKVG